MFIFADMFKCGELICAFKRSTPTNPAAQTSEFDVVGGVRREGAPAVHEIRAYGWKKMQYVSYIQLIIQKYFKKINCPRTYVSIFKGEMVCFVSEYLQSKSS